MWSSADNDVYVHCYNTLVNSKIMQEVIGNRIYDTVQKNATFPYAIVGETSITNNESSTNMTESVGITLHVYSQAVNQYEVKEIMNRVAYLLNRRYQTDDFIIEKSNVDTREVIMDIDEFTKHGIIRMLYKVRHKTKF